MNPWKYAVLLVVILLVSPGATVAQDLGSTMEKAKTLYAAGNFTPAFELLVQAAPTTADSATKTAVSDRLMVMAEAEYARKNFKNAYAAVRAAQRIRPTNQAATQLFLKMKGELDVNNLTNASDVQTAPAPSVKTAEAASTTPATSQPPTTKSRSAAAPASKPAPARVSAAPAVPAGSSGAAANETRSNGGRTSDMASPSASADPQTQELLALLTARIEQASDPFLNPSVLVILIAVSALILVLVVVLLVVAFRRNQPASEALLTGPGRPSRLEGPRGDPVPVDEAEAQDLALRKGLLRVERLYQLQDELRRGGNRWDIIKAHLDDLDASLKAEILNAVEDKLNTGDLVSYDAVLPIVLPFLTEYEDFFREKAERLAQTAVLTAANRGAELALYSRDLFKIPDRLKEVLKGRDRSLLTAKLTKAVAKKLGLSMETRERMYQGALIHDAGYLFLEPHELHRVLGKNELTPAEIGMIRTHAELGVDAVKSLNLTLTDEHRHAILHHHERMDGSGYPQGLKGEEIPLVARIIGVCETFVALLSPRPYRPKVDLSQALAIVQDGVPAKFDRQVVEAFVAVIRATGGV